jgi:hypothetical protein
MLDVLLKINYVRNEKLCGIIISVVIIIKMFLNETYSRVQVGEHLSGMFPIKNSVKREMLYHYCFSVLL